MAAPRALPRLACSTRSIAFRRPRPAGRRGYASQGPPSSRGSQAAVATAVAAAGAGAWYWSTMRSVPEAKPSEAEIVSERPRKKAASKEEHRDIISSQHLQVKKSWENPGLYAWGSNTGRVAAPESSESFVKTPRRIPFFDGVLLRDVKLDRAFGAAIDEKGDLLQWGTGYSPDTSSPVKTLRGKNLTSLAISRDRIIGLSTDGSAYSVPVSKDAQLEGPRQSESSWVPFWSSGSDISYRKLQPASLAWNEKISAIDGGLEHILLLTNKGRLFSAASGTQDFPSKGQLGVPGLTWTTRPEGAYDQPHEITTLRGFEITQVAAGDFHSLAVDKDGRVFSFGDNTSGQLGLESSAESPFIDAPSLLPISRLYAGNSQVPVVTGVAAGGANSYFTVDATKVAAPGSSSDDVSASPARLGLGRVTADAFACGQGIYGALGNGRWTHVQGTPTKIPTLSGLFEWDEAENKVVPIRLSRLSVGANHVAAVMDNVTHLRADGGTGDNDTNWGADILFFGNNEYYQLGTGKRNNVNAPVYIQPLDGEAERKIRGREEHRFQITPLKRVKVNGRWVDLEQRVECGRGVTAVYSGV